ncbi:MAG TPA: molybdenum cofactor biosynthesis protein MoaE [Dermatophilaceae bacterium]|nr:molybdenum cofactor biosynthesis protein MoaE [Dermatophilaceae bacterium]
MTPPHDDRSDDPVALVDVLDARISVDDTLEAVASPSAGGVCLFVGVVRDHDEGREVRALAYSAHPTALQRLQEVATAVAARHPGSRLAAVHRVGPLEVGDVAVVAAASAAHRDLAFEACRDLIDTLKAEVPIWKRQHFGDGGAGWVGMP